MTAKKRQRTGCDMSEHEHQVALFKWSEMNLSTMPELALMYCIANGGARSKATAGRLKAEGVKAGVPDICLPLPTATAGALYIELKVPASPGKRAGRESDAQKEWRELLVSVGNAAYVAWGWEDAVGWIVPHIKAHRLHVHTLTPNV